MSDQFFFDVFLSHSLKDNEIVRPLAEQLLKDGLRVWFAEWEFRLGEGFLDKVEKGLEQARVLVLCMSAQAFGSEWAELEARAFRFRDPLNKDRRFIPLRLDESPIRGPLAQFPYINWLPAGCEEQYRQLLEFCRPPTKSLAVEREREQTAKRVLQLKYKRPGVFVAYAFNADGKTAVTASNANVVQIWDMETGSCLQTLEGHNAYVWSVAWSANRREILSSSRDRTVRLWDVETGRCLRVFEGHQQEIGTVSWSVDQAFAISGSCDNMVRLWDVETGRCLRVFEGHTDAIESAELSSDGGRVLSGSRDKTVRLWDVETGRCLRVLEGHTNAVMGVTWNKDNLHALSGSEDRTIRLWDVDAGRCLRVLEGHTGSVRRLAWSSDHRYVLSGAMDETVRMWDIETGFCSAVLEGHWFGIVGLAWSADQRRAFSGDQRGSIRVWDLMEHRIQELADQTYGLVPAPPSYQVQYTNAKVLIVGESGVGKTGLSKVLAGEEWQPSDSTVGAWATQWKLPAFPGNGVDREVWLWDFGGQADQRLIHQLYMEDTALAVLVFDGQKDDVFETLGQWDRDLTRASRKPFAKVLVAGRVDAGGLRMSRSQIEAFVKERGFVRYLETSAKVNLGCDELKNAILDGIRWADIPWRSSPLLFKQLKEEILKLKDEGRVLMRFNELREALQLRLLGTPEARSGEYTRVKDEELKAVVGLLAGPGVVWELSFGSWVLLQPERINAYAQAVIQTLRDDKHERGCLPEERVLNGDLIYHSSVRRLESDEERFVLLAMHQTLVGRGLCLREQTERGPLLIFPSYHRRERPELVGHPAVLVSYRFNGFLDDIYATLVVRLHHTKPFHQDELWRYAADFQTLTGKQLGVKLTRHAEGSGELEVYFDSTISIGEKIIFSKYVHEHLLQNASDVVRLRHYVCPHCGTPVGNRGIAMKKLAEGRKDIPCVNCDHPAKRILLWDEMEEMFASDEMKNWVNELQAESKIVLDNESKDRVLVGEVISTVALAGQLSREFNVSDHGIDMEIEFKSDTGEATGKKLYLQLKSGDSYLRQRRNDGVEVFNITNDRHSQYWMNQAFPVFLVLRNSKGEIRWMEVRDWLKKANEKSRAPVRQIIFEGERFDVMSVRRWREEVLSNAVDVDAGQMDRS